MRGSIIKRLQQSMDEHGLDALVCLSPENFTYVSGFVVPSQSLMRWRHAAIVVTADGHCAYMVVDMEESTVKSKVNGADVRVWGEFTEKPMQVMAELLKDMGLANAKVGTEMDYLFAGDYKELTNQLPDAEIISACCAC